MFSAQHNFKRVRRYRGVNIQATQLPEIIPGKRPKKLTAGNAKSERIDLISG